MLRLLVVVLLLSCGQDSAPRSTSGVARDNAGQVRALTGQVTATRGAATRTLAVGNSVGADEMIDTGSDGAVVIELAHNNALWSLEPGIKARVDQSVAWGLPKQEVAKPAEHTASSVGRHADRQISDTQAPADEGLAHPTAESAAATSGRASPRRAEPTTSLPQLTPPEPMARPPLEPLPASPSRRDLMAGVNGLKPRIRACVAKGDAHGVLKLEIKVGGDGNAASAEIKQSVDPVIDQCVIEAVKTLKLPRSQHGVTFTFPFQL